MISGQTLTESEIIEYESAQESPFYYEIPLAGFLHLAGPDRGDYLQRQTTNDIDLLSPGHLLETVLTNPAARILDLLTVFERPESSGSDPAIGILTLPGRTANTLEYFRQRIFFMDKVSLDDLSSETIQILVSGQDSDRALQALGFQEPPQEGTFQRAEINDASIIIFPVGKIVGESYLVLSGKGNQADIQDRLINARIMALGQSVYDILRVEAGRPGPESELTESYTPLEIGLDDTVSANKGCYTGQEVLARQITYDKVTQRLVGIQVSEPVEAGKTITVEGKKTGKVTSAVQSPNFGPLAMAVIRRPYNEPGTEVDVGENSGTKGVVTNLPFRE